METVYNFQVKRPNGEVQSLEEFEGKVILIVNTASKCGFTPQLKGLQELYDMYRQDGLEILGFPSDQFNNQEFDQIEDTMNFCQVNYGVTFPLYAKIDVNGQNADPLFQFLTSQKKGVLSNKVKWNFTKFLVNREGQVVERYAPTTEPKKMEEDIKKLL